MTSHLGALLKAIGREDEETVSVLTQVPGQGGTLHVRWTTVADADAMVNSIVGCNVWHGVQALDRPDSGRGKAVDITGLVALYADIDFKHDGKPDGMDRVDAMTLVNKLSNLLGTDPVGIVASGNGIQPYWRVERVDVDFGRQVLSWWRYSVLAIAAEMQVYVDSQVFDLPRILRTPGPPNLKDPHNPKNTTWVPKLGYPLTRTDLFQLMQAHPIPELAEKNSKYDRRGGDLSPRDSVRYFTVDQAQRYWEEHILSDLRETPEGAGFNSALNCAAFNLAAFVPAFLTHEEAESILSDECARRWGSANQQDWATIDSGMRACSWEAYVTPEDLANNPFWDFYESSIVEQAEETIEVAFIEAESDVQQLGPGRRLVMQSAADIKMTGTRWLWREGKTCWIPLGGLTLMGGREGVAKSTWCFKIAADITNGTLPGHHFGKPKDVIICATEDGWGSTIKPRLIAAGADVSRIWRVDVAQNEIMMGLTLPKDVTALATAIKEKDVALVILDPLLGTIGSGDLDTHKDSDVRIALEPISRLADESGASFIGLIHVNKSTGGDLATRFMGSRAFIAVARAALACVQSRDQDEDGYYFGQIKNSLGEKVHTSIKYSIEGTQVGYDEEMKEPIISSYVHVLDPECSLSIEQAADGADGNRGERKETMQQKTESWLIDQLKNGPLNAKLVKNRAEIADISRSSLYRATASLDVRTTGPRTDPDWYLSGHEVSNHSEEV